MAFRRHGNQPLCAAGVEYPIKPRDINAFIVCNGTAPTDQRRTSPQYSFEEEVVCFVNG